MALSTQKKPGDAPKDIPKSSSNSVKHSPFHQRATNIRSPQLSKTTKKIILVGFEDKFKKDLQKHLSENDKNEYSCESSNDIYDLLERCCNEPLIVVLGPMENTENQLMVLEYVKKNSDQTQVIYVTDEQNPNSALIISCGADDIVSKDQIQPAALSKRIKGVVKLRELRAAAKKNFRSYEPIICQAKSGEMAPIGPERVEEVKETMEEFSFFFDRHQKRTRHYAVMHAILTAYADYLGNVILDVGCGTGYPMRTFVVEDILIPDFDADPPLRESTTILSVDNSLPMLVQARENYHDLIQEYPNIFKEGALDLRFMEADFLDLDPVLLKTEVGSINTIMLSYIMHWVDNKEATVKKCAELVSKGAHLITVEEFPQIVTPGPYMSLELARKIEEKVLPIERKDLYKLFRKYGFKDVSGGVMVLPIDSHHQMYGNVFEKV